MDGPPLLLACMLNHLEIVRRMVAQRGGELILDVAEIRGHPEIFSLLSEQQADPMGCRRKIRTELELPAHPAAELFALTVFLCDEFVRHKRRPKRTAPTGSTRFLMIASKLPLELQMILCYHVVGSTRQNILVKDSEEAFRYLGWLYSLYSLRTSLEKIFLLLPTQILPRFFLLFFVSFLGHKCP